LQLVVILALELVTFPLGAGAFMLFCAAPLFTQNPILSEIVKRRDIAFGALFMTWLVGTM
jgi:hypothetical protein